MSARILVVEDDESLGLVLVDALTQEGYEPVLQQDGVTALETALARRFDLVILDLMLPRMDGLQVCKRLREAGRRTPVLMLTARGREEDRVKGLDVGADDYLVKPFSLKELLARVRARLRAGVGALPDVVRFGGAEVDFAALVVRRGQATMALTKTEADLLRFLARHPGVALSRKRFLDEVWGYERFPTTRTVDMHVARVREKVGDDGAEPQVIRTVHGVGYRYDPAPGDTASA
ncbi:MAG TPA: response regulator transcription factor [Planctomycetota bacterium]|nr:response regulator transcription factor [Planctomycetota bacterium]